MNLKWVSALLVDPDKHAVKTLSNMLEGFGLVKQKVVETGEAAKMALDQELFDIVFCEAVLPNISSEELIRWLRRLESKPIRLIPVVVLTRYTQRSLVEASRDAGASVVVKKPVPANVLYERLDWVAKGTRLFVECAGYAGPDRRFKNTGLPGGVGRRATDLSGDLGDPAAPNLSQQEIDSMIKPMKLEL